MDPCGTPNKVSLQELCVEFIFVLSFLLFKFLCISLNAAILNPSALQPVFTCSKLTTETLDQGVKYVQC